MTEQLTSSQLALLTVSGPLGPSEEVRRQCRRVTSPMAILRGDPRGDIHFHSELFGW